MANPAVTPIYDISDKGFAPDVRTTLAGWIGSLAGRRGDFVTEDTNGFITQAVASSGTPGTFTAVGSTTKVGLLVTDVASTVAAASSDALAVQERVLADGSEVGLSLVNNSETLIAVGAADQGKIYGLGRLSTASGAQYVADKNGTTHFHVTRVDTTRGILWGTIVATLRLK